MGSPRPSLLAALLVAATAVSDGGTVPGAALLPVVVAHENSTPAGTTSRGVLTIRLDAREAIWHPDGDSLAGLQTIAFAEGGGDPLAPGPLIRMPLGTELRISVHNALGHDSLVFHLPAAVVPLAAGAGPLVIAAGETREIRGRASRAGTYVYRATTDDPVARRTGFEGLLSGALIVDPLDGVPLADERVLVLQTQYDALNALGFPDPARSIFAINGRSWPYTRRVEAVVGDSLHWRVVNASPDVHPMHLHGFYYRVDAHDAAPSPEGPARPGRMVVTERLLPGDGMRTTWVPERPGNWLFHCHFQAHVAPHRPLGDAVPARRDPHASHAMTGMAGLVVGVEVRPRTEGAAARAEQPRRRLRLVAEADRPDGPGDTTAHPSMRFTIAESRHPTLSSRRGISPTMVLARDEPVAVTVVNHLAEATAVHWHGIELESYFDGVAGFSGSPGHLSPIIAPGDSFVARFTPPRAGTFIYHSHVDEPVQHRAGLLGALVVTEPGASIADDRVFVIKSARLDTARIPAIEVNGTQRPDTVVLHADRPHRLRFVVLPNAVPNLLVTLTARVDSVPAAPDVDPLVVQWRPVAKDGFDVPESQRAAVSARMIMGMGETYDFEVVAPGPRTLNIELRGPGLGGVLVGRVPVRVEAGAHGGRGRGGREVTPARRSGRSGSWTARAPPP